MTRVNKELHKHLAVNVKELSKLIGLSTDTIYTLVSQRRIPHVKVGRRVLFPAKAIENWLDENTIHPISR